MKKVLALITAITFLCNSLAFAGLHGTTWCDPDGYYTPETGMTYPCETYYYGQIVSTGSPYDAVPGLSYIDLDPYFIFWMWPFFLLYGTFLFGVGEYSIEEETLSYSTIGLRFLKPFSGQVTLSLVYPDEDNMTLNIKEGKDEHCFSN